MTTALSPRSRRLVRWAALPVAVLASGVIVSTASYAAFTSSTDNSGNAWSAGSIALSDDDSGAAVVEHVGHGARRRRHDGQAAGHRLQDRQREGLGSARQAHDVGLGEGVVGAGRPAPPAHAVAQVGGRQRLETLAVGSVAEDV